VGFCVHREFPDEMVAKAGGAHAPWQLYGVGSRAFQKHLLDGYLIAVCTARWP
jgi:hypothetical protein